jgi:hypothetical protein
VRDLGLVGAEGAKDGLEHVGVARGAGTAGGLVGGVVLLVVIVEEAEEVAREGESATGALFGEELV